MRLLAAAISGFAEVIMLLLCGRAICSWFARPGGTAYKVYQVFVMLTEPIVAPCRMITSRFRTGSFDFSVLIAFFLVIIIRDILFRIISIII